MIPCFWVVTRVKFFLKTFPAVFINVSSRLDSKLSISKFIFSISFACNSSKSFHLMICNSFSNVSLCNFSSLLFHINLCGLSFSVQFEVFVLLMWVGYFHKILYSTGPWFEKVIKICTERYCIKFVLKMFSEAKTKPTVLQT